MHIRQVKLKGSGGMQAKESLLGWSEIGNPYSQIDRSIYIKKEKGCKVSETCLVSSNEYRLAEYGRKKHPSG